MSLQIEAQEYLFRIVVIKLEGRLDAFEAPNVRSQCDQHIANGVNHFVFDLSNVSALDSAGLAVMVSVLKRTRQQNGDVRIIWPKTETAARILKLTKFDQVFTAIQPSEIIPRGF